jgi:hypothetical protein
MTVEVQLLKYKFRFRKLDWREEVALQMPPKVHPLRVILAAVLVDVSGLPVSSPEEAMKIIRKLPIPVLNRVYMIYKDKLPKTRLFETVNLFQAPEPSLYIERVADDEAAAEPTVDEAVRRMEQQFGKQELAEAAAIDRKIVQGSKLRGAVRVDHE